MEKDPTTSKWPEMDRSSARTMEIFRRLALAEGLGALDYPDGSSIAPSPGSARPPLLGTVAGSAVGRE